MPRAVRASAKRTELLLKHVDQENGTQNSARMSRPGAKDPTFAGAAVCVFFAFIPTSNEPCSHWRLAYMVCFWASLHVALTPKKGSFL